MTHYVAVIDLGKTNSKLAIVDTDSATECEVLTQPATVSKTGPYPHLDCDAIESFILRGLHELCSRWPIEALTVATHGATVALITETGQLALPVIDYEYSGIDSLADTYDALRANFADTGSPRLPGGLNVGAQLYWLQQSFPQDFARADTMLTWPQYWVYRLTGSRFNDLTSLGCHTDLYEPLNGCYSALVNSQHWRRLMPPVCRSGKPSGVLHAQLAHQWMLPDNIPVYSGIHDSNASLVPHLLTQSSAFSVVSTGTWFISMAMGGEKIALDEAQDTLLNINAMGDPVPSARFMGGRERDQLTTGARYDEEIINSLLDEANPSPLLLMPSHITGTGPYPHLKTRWINEAPPISAAMKECALTLYLAMMTAECLTLIGAKGPVCLEGPLAQDTLYAQLLSASLSRPVIASQSATGTSCGAAMLISQPIEPPKPTALAMAPGRLKQLEQYAKRWREQLAIHAR